MREGGGRVAERGEGGGEARGEGGGNGGREERGAERCGKGNEEWSVGWAEARSRRAGEDKGGCARRGRKGA